MALKNKILKWGILGVGNMAHNFVHDLLLVPEAKVLGAASRSADKSKKFASQYQLPNSYENYEQLLVDSTIDIVYIATPHHNHAELAIKAMECGKHVLCEKPLAVNKIQVQQMVSTSVTQNKFLMEALWSRFNPCINLVFDHIKNGDIGEVNYINADFGLVIDKGAGHRIHHLDTAGGALLELGVYPVFLAYSILGMPTKILASGKLDKQTGTDIQTGIILKSAKGIASLYAGFNSESDMIAKIYGTEGRIYLDPYWHETETYSITKGNDADTIVQEYSSPRKGKGFVGEIEECFKCIMKKEIQSTLWSHADSLNLISIMDDIRDQVGLRYPFE